MQPMEGTAKLYAKASIQEEIRNWSHVYILPQCSSPLYQATSPCSFLIYVLVPYDWYNGVYFALQLES